MTDDRIAELFGWRTRWVRSSSLMHCIRIIAAEAQVEQDAARAAEPSERREG